MQKRFNQVVMIICLINLILLASMALNGRSTRAATKRVYKSEVVVGAGAIQAVLDQRGSERWHLISASGYAYPNGTTTEAVTVLIFEKE